MKTKLLILLFLSGVYMHSQENSTINIGDRISHFEAIDDTGKMWDSKTISTDYLVVYFYPAAMTGGCTKQACAYRDDKSVLDTIGATVVGVSGDNVENLTYFKEAYELNFTLLSDQNGALSKLFGVPTRNGGSITREIAGKNVVLERSLTTPRWTFVLDKNGQIVYKNSSVNASEDSSEVKKAIIDHKNSR